MKNILLTTAALLAACILAPARAQTITVSSPDYSATPLFSTAPGFTITGMAADANGDIYYLQTDGSFATSTFLFKRTAASGYAEPAGPLFDLGSAVFGSFVEIGAGRLFLGENSTNQIFAVNRDGSGADLLGTVIGNFDAAYTAAGLLISHNPAAFPAAANVVSAFALVPDGGGGEALAAGDVILDTGSDFSGPIALDSTGSLYYGATAFNGISDLYRYSSGEIAGAFGPTALTLDGAHRFLANGLNSYLAAGPDTQLWHSDYSSLKVIDTIAGTAIKVATSASSISHLDIGNGKVFTNVTDFTASRSTVYAVIPEPCSSWMAAAGLIGILLRRGNRRTPRLL